MNSATIALTSEQKAIIAEKMGLVSDELGFLSSFVNDLKCSEASIIIIETYNKMIDIVNYIKTESYN